MTTYIRFTPSNSTSPPFQFTAELDGNDYIISVTWNVYGQRWYITCTDVNGTVVRHEPLIGSPDSGDVYLLPGLFTSSTLLYRESSGNFEVS